MERYSVTSSTSPLSIAARIGMSPSVRFATHIRPVEWPPESSSIPMLPRVRAFSYATSGVYTVVQESVTVVRESVKRRVGCGPPRGGASARGGGPVPPRLGANGATSSASPNSDREEGDRECREHNG